MSKTHFEIKNKESVLPLTDCLCKKVPFPKLTDNWDEVTCKYCLKLKDSHNLKTTSEDRE
jgi:hypothetical protein